MIIKENKKVNVININNSKIKIVIIIINIIDSVRKLRVVKGEGGYDVQNIIFGSTFWKNCLPLLRIEKKRVYITSE